MRCLNGAYHQASSRSSLTRTEQRLTAARDGGGSLRRGRPGEPRSAAQAVSRSWKSEQPAASPGRGRRSGALGREGADFRSPIPRNDRPLRSTIPDRPSDKRDFGRAGTTRVESAVFSCGSCAARGIPASTEFARRSHLEATLPLTGTISGSRDGRAECCHQAKGTARADPPRERRECRVA